MNQTKEINVGNTSIHLHRAKLYITETVNTSIVNEGPETCNRNVARFDGVCRK